MEGREPGETQFGGVENQVRHSLKGRESGETQFEGVENLVRHSFEQYRIR